MIGFEGKIIPLDRWITQFVDWLVEEYRPFFQLVKMPVEFVLQHLTHGFQATP